jgi:hypothetical protein
MRIPFFGKVVLGFLTISQLFIGLGFLVWILSVLLPAIQLQDDALIESVILGSLKGIFLWIIIISFLSLAMLVFYIIHAGIHKSLSTTMKVVWIVLFLIFGSFVEVVYFFMEIVPENSMTARLERT